MTPPRRRDAYSTDFGLYVKSFLHLILIFLFKGNFYFCYSALSNLDNIFRGCFDQQVGILNFLGVYFNGSLLNHPNCF